MEAFKEEVLGSPPATRVSWSLRDQKSERLRRVPSQSGQYFLSNALKGEEIGLEEIDDGIWNIIYYNTILGRIDRQTGKITGNEKV